MTKRAPSTPCSALCVAVFGGCRPLHTPLLSRMGASDTMAQVGLWIFYLVLGCRGLPTATQVLVDWTFSDREPPCFHASCGHLRKEWEGPLLSMSGFAWFCWASTLFGKAYQLVDWGTGFMFLSAMSHMFCLKEQPLLLLLLSSVKMKEFKVIVRFIPCWAS